MRRALCVVGALTVASVGCGGDDDESGSFPPKNPEQTEPDSGAAPPDNACPPETAAMLPAGFDPETCWTVAPASDPVIIDETVFALVETEDATPALVAFDAASGEQLWASDPLPGPVNRMAQAEVDGEPGVAVLVVEDDAGDAVTAASQAWSYLAWPADVGKKSPADPAIRISAPAESTSFEEVRWTDQGILAGDQLLRPDHAAFEPVEVEPEPILVGDYYDLEESFVGVSGDALLSYVSGVAWTEGGPENGSTYVGWVARGGDGTQTWDTVTSTPNEGENVLYFEGPVRIAVVIGDYALAVIPTDDTYTAFDLEWVRASTGEPANPQPEDLAGSIPVAVSTDVIADAVDATLSPNGQYLFLTWSTLPLVVDLDAKTATVVDSDFEITAQAIDDTTVHATTNGNLTIDLETATATPLPTPQESLDAVTGTYGAITTEGTNSDTEYLVVARRDS